MLSARRTDVMSKGRATCNAFVSSLISRRRGRWPTQGGGDAVDAALERKLRLNDVSGLSAKLGAKRGISYRPQDRGAEFVRSGRSNQQAVDPILDELRNAGGARGIHRHALVASLVEHIGLRGQPFPGQ